jgi:hypothetical protein
VVCYNFIFFYGLVKKWVQYIMKSFVIVVQLGWLNKWGWDEKDM